MATAFKASDDGITYACEKCGREVSVFVSVKVSPACSRCKQRMTAPAEVSRVKRKPA